MIRQARHRAAELGLGFDDKVLGWILPKYLELVTEEDDLNVLPSSMRADARQFLGDNVRADQEYWRVRCGPLHFGDLPGPEECTYRPQGAGQHSRPFPYIRDEQPEGFFCMNPFTMLNINVENTFACCHAAWPLNHMTFGHINGIFDVWNHPLLQFVRRSLFNGQAVKEVCQPTCPYFRKGGNK